MRALTYMICQYTHTMCTSVRCLSDSLQAFTEDWRAPMLYRIMHCFIYCASFMLQATVKYIDPSYMIRSVAANSFDQVSSNSSTLLVYILACSFSLCSSLYDDKPTTGESTCVLKISYIFKFVFPDETSVQRCCCSYSTTA
jgi:hypothetical protein